MGRNHPTKGHAIFLEAAKLVLSANPDVYVAVIGRGVDTDPQLNALVRGSGFNDRVRLVGEQQEIHRINAALDIACNSSIAEAFSNAVGEAMATGLPCVVTEVGHSPMVVGDDGLVVPPGNPRALAAEILRFARDREERMRRGDLARKRIETLYSIKHVSMSYDALYGRIV